MLSRILPKQINFRAILLHDVALLQDGEQVAPCPVDHQASRHGRQHECEDQRHPVEHRGLDRISWCGVQAHLHPHGDAHQDRPDAQHQQCAAASTESGRTG